MTRVNISHLTEYHYSEPVRFGLHRLVLRPREGHRTTVVRHELRLEPRARLFWMNDLYGNHVAMAEFETMSDHLVITSDVAVDFLNPREDEAPMEGSRCSLLTWPLVYPAMEEPVVAGYLHHTHPGDQERVGEWVHQVVAGKEGWPAMAVTTQVMRAIHEQTRYLRREEPGVQSPSDTLTLRTGSCRDMATLMMEACRTLGIAARFASGYLDSRASSAGHGATHAWTEVYLPDCGWCGFDPTIGELVSSKHIALGVSAHPRGVMPVSGIFSGVPGCYRGMKVSVAINKVAADTPAS